MALTAYRLRRWYLADNRKYFGGALPKTVKICLTPDSEHRGWVEGETPETATIHINPDCGGHSGYAHVTLIHEMVHIEQWPSAAHGSAFKRRMRQLAQLGATDGLL